MKTRMLGRFIRPNWRAGRGSPSRLKGLTRRLFPHRGYSTPRRGWEPLQARADLTAVDLHHHDRAARCRADIEHLPPVLESVLLRHVQVTAEMDARHDRLERVEEAALSAVRAPGRQVRQSHGAS